MDALWRDHSPNAAANNLYQAVHAARRALGPDVIDVRDELISLAPDVDLDVDRFTKAAEEAAHLGTAAAVREALALYPGELLPENRYDDWADEPRGRLATVHAELAAQLHELGSGSRLGQLPIEASSFVGRGRELQELRGLLGRTRLLTLTGVGGAGKTRLGLELARTVGDDVRGRRRARRAGAGRGAEHRSGGRRGSARRARAPGPGPERGDPRLSRKRSLLLVLDNCEHLIGASAELVDAILRSAGELTILATSREPLRVSGETVFRVPSLAIPDPEQRLPPEELVRYESVHLFAERAATCAPRIRGRRAQRRRRREDLLPSRRVAARARARGRSARRAQPGRDRGAPRRPVPLAAGRQPRGAVTPADAPRDAPLEPRPARARGGDALPPAGGVLRRVQARRSGGGVRRRRAGRGGRRRPPRKVGREVARRGGRRRRHVEIRPARHGPGLRAGPSRRGRRVDRARTAARALDALVRRARTGIR